MSCFNYFVKYKVIIKPNYDSFRKSQLSINNEMVEALQKLKVKKIGLYTRKDFQEYPLWCALNANETGIKIEAVKVDNHYKYMKI